MLGAASAHAALTYRETAPAGGLSPAYLARQFLSSLGNLSSYHNGAGSAIYAMYAYGLCAKVTVAAATAMLLHGQLRLTQVRGRPGAAATWCVWGGAVGTLATGAAVVGGLRV